MYSNARIMRLRLTGGSLIAGTPSLGLPAT
jgi:hypothetical protein